MTSHVSRSAVDFEMGGWEVCLDWVRFRGVEVR